MGKQEAPAAPALGALNVKQLQAECKRLGLKGYTGLNKEKLVALLHPTSTTIGEEEAEEAAAPIDGKDAKGGKRKGKEAAGAAPKAKKNKKADAAAEASEEEALGALSVKELKEKCKLLGLKGYTGLNKEKLVALLRPASTTAEASEEEIEDESEEDEEEEDIFGGSSGRDRPEERESKVSLQGTQGRVMREINGLRSHAQSCLVTFRALG
jgi:hypothetical protein